MEKWQKMAENGRLLAKQEKTILELANPSTQSLAEVASKVSVGERTLYRWMSDSHFKDELSKARQKVREESIKKLKANFSKAVERLDSLLDSKDESVKLRACKTVLDYNMKLVEIAEIEERLSKLEGLRQGDGKDGVDKEKLFQECVKRVTHFLMYGEGSKPLG